MSVDPTKVLKGPYLGIGYGNTGCLASHQNYYMKSKNRTAPAECASPFIDTSQLIVISRAKGRVPAACAGATAPPRCALVVDGGSSPPRRRHVLTW